MFVPAVSVIIPCHNDGRFLDGLMANLGEQSFRDFEVLIVNDGSTEQETLNTLAKLRSDVRVVDQENRYLPGARNRGFSEALADIVLPLDCDDRLDPSYLAETYNVLGHAPADIGFVYTHMRLAGALTGTYVSFFDRFDQLFMNRLPYCMLFRKSAWSAVGGYDESMRDGGEDWEFNVKLAEAHYRGIEIAKPSFIYAVRPDGMLLSKSARIQGAIWRQIRTRHVASYRLPTLIGCWRASGSNVYSALRAMILLTTTQLLPESWFNGLYFRLMKLARRWRAGRSQLQSAQLRL